MDTICPSYEGSPGKPAYFSPATLPFCESPVYHNLCSTFVGFDKRAATLLREAKRVLVYQSVLKTKSAEAFLAFLRSLQQQTEDNIISDYSKFYQELSRTSCASWQDFVLEEVSLYYTSMQQQRS